MHPQDCAIVQRHISWTADVNRVSSKPQNTLSAATDDCKNQRTREQHAEQTTQGCIHTPHRRAHRKNPSNAMCRIATLAGALYPKRIQQSVCCTIASLAFVCSAPLIITPAPKRSIVLGGCAADKCLFIGHATPIGLCNEAQQPDNEACTVHFA